MPALNTIECRHTRQDGTESLAIYSEDMKYRYLLERIWDPAPDTPVLIFVMLNPLAAIPTAALVHSDTAIATCENRAKEHHDNFGGTQFGGFCVTNLFAFVQKDKNNYERVDDQSGTENLRIIEEYARRPNTTIICAWGNECNDDRFAEQVAIIKKLLAGTEHPLHHLESLSNNQPKHPIHFTSSVDFSIWAD